ncbi:ectonucleotide pyrophosphatase/phosphodiesterase [Opitutus terrae]|uniref:Nucleotide diphosphatase n=1 Tax=Opitutus terrae (strain DSM 11246 / JCM 15787 / PB90-1) TaxID=452637 RepID=B1ZUQ8_OPITP|nr:ectonucleotide pyrophosphatase/phosphodiesterase [Opitutus terrae]ACB74942.1 Nucleotide diphosphatase [Opitutus terrae PB90-1]
MKSRCRRRILFLVLCLLALLPRVGSAAETVPPLVLISLDGFRWDYCAHYADETPNLHRFMREGTSARGLIPVFPSNTFPNHYSIVTGLYPSHHGIINNQMRDVRLGPKFVSSQRASVQDSRWWHGEPIWATAVRQGRKSGCLFWIGSEAAIEGVRPTWWRPFDPQAPFSDRLAELVRWFSLPEPERPAVATFYFEESNSAGHHFGPDSPKLARTLRQLDAEIGEIRDRLARLGLTPNYVIVSDHGMTSTSPERVVLLDDYLDLGTVELDFEHSTVGLRPRPGVDPATVLTALAKLPAVAKAYRAEELPAHFHVDPHSPRVPPIWIVPAEGWQVMSRVSFAKAQREFPQGQHGYDPQLESMHGILIASGPSFQSGGTVIERVENIHIYNLLCAALHLSPAPNDGDDRLVKAMLR